MPAFTLSRRRALVAVVGAGARSRLARGARLSSRSASPRALVPAQRHDPGAGRAAPAASARRRSSSSTSPARCAGPGSTACRRARGSPTRSRAPGGATARADPSLVNLAAPLADGAAGARSRARGLAGRRRPARRRCRAVADRPGRASTPRRRAARHAARSRPGHGAEDRRLPAGARAVHVRRPARRDPRHRPGAAREPARPRRAVIWTRAPAHMLAGVALSRPRLRERRAHPRARARRARCVAAAAVVVADAPAARLGCAALLLVRRSAGGGRAQRLDALDRSPLQRDDRPGRTRGRRRDGSAVAVVATTSACRGASAVSTASPSTSASSSSCRSAGRRRREPSWRCSPSSGCRAGPSAASTSARGCAATACTSCSTSTSGSAIGRRGGVGGFADRPPRAACALDRARSRGRTARGPRRDRRSATTRRCPTTCATTSAPPGSTTCSRSRDRTSSSSRAACWCSRGSLGVTRWIGELGALAGIGGVRARGRCAAVRRPRRDRRRARLARLARRAGCATRGTPCCSAAIALLAWNPYLALRRRLPALVRSGRGDLRARAAALAPARGLSAAARSSAWPSPSRPRAALATAPILWLAVRRAAAADASRRTRSPSRRSRCCSGSPSSRPGSTSSRPPPRRSSRG